MRLDKYLKVSRLIKRRTVANEACDAGRITVNGKVAKASQQVKAGDILEITFGNRSVKAEILKIAETTKKEEAAEMFRYLSVAFRGFIGYDNNRMTETEMGNR